MYTATYIPDTISPFFQPRYVMQALHHDTHGKEVMTHGAYNATGGEEDPQHGINPVLATNQPETVQPTITDAATTANTAVANTENKAISGLSEAFKNPRVEYFAIAGAAIGLVAGKTFHLPLIWSALLFSAGAAFYAYHKQS